MNFARSTSTIGAEGDRVEPGVGGAAAPDAAGDPHAASANPIAAPAIHTTRARRAIAVERLLRHRRRPVSANHGIPRQLGAVAATLGHDLDPFWRDRDGVDLTFVFEFALDALVEFRGHCSRGFGMEGENG